MNLHLNRLKRLLVWTAALAIMEATAAEQDISWHHSPSPYRSIHQIQQPPSPSRAGVAVEVPTCGLGSRDLRAYSKNGDRLPLLKMGQGSGNNTLILVGTPENAPKDTLIVYFGSGRRAEQNPHAFRPGLRAKVHTFNSPTMPNTRRQAQRLLQQEEELGNLFMDSFSLGGNPLAYKNSLAIEFSAYFTIEESGEHTFFLISENAGFLSINNQTLIERGGAVTASDLENYRGTIRLSRGTHQLSGLVFNRDGRFTAVAGTVNEDADDREDIYVPFSEAKLHQAGISRRRKVQSRTRHPAPLFDYETIAYIGYEDQYYHLVELQSLTGIAASWNVDNSLQSRGKKTIMVIPGASSRPITVRVNGQTLEGIIRFPQKAPPRKSISNTEDFEQFVNSMKNVSLSSLNTSDLLDYYKFIRHQEAHTWLGELARELAQRDEINQEKLYQIHLDLARNTEGEKAFYNYRQAWRRLPIDDRNTQERLTREIFHFLTWRLNDFQQAENQLRLHQRNVSGLKERQINLLRLDLALAQGKQEQAEEIYRKITSELRLIRDQRQAEARGGALRRSFYNLLDEGRLDEAQEKLDQWDQASPFDRSTGALPLARARLFQRFGWHKAALRVLEQTELLSPEPIKLPEILSEKQRLREYLQLPEEAEQTRKRLQEKFPEYQAD